MGGFYYNYIILSSNSYILRSILFIVSRNTVTNRYSFVYGIFEKLHESVGSTISLYEYFLDFVDYGTYNYIGLNTDKKLFCLNSLISLICTSDGLSESKSSEL